jgi:hypothetical protein
MHDSRQLVKDKDFHAAKLDQFTDAFNDLSNIISRVGGPNNSTKNFIDSINEVLKKNNKLPDEVKSLLQASLKELHKLQDQGVLFFKSTSNSDVPQKLEEQNRMPLAPTKSKLS